jgi:hypothetical protein
MLCKIFGLGLIDVDERLNFMRYMGLVMVYDIYIYIVICGSIMVHYLLPI